MHHYTNYKPNKERTHLIPIVNWEEPDFKDYDSGVHYSNAKVEFQNKLAALPSIPFIGKMPDKEILEQGKDFLFERHWAGCKKNIKTDCRCSYWNGEAEVCENAKVNIVAVPVTPIEDKGEEWTSIEKELPMCLGVDFLTGTKYEVKYKDGKIDKTRVSDHNVWYYMAKDAGITHWRKIPLSPIEDVKEEGVSEFNLCINLFDPNITEDDLIAKIMEALNQPCVITTIKS